MPGQIASFMGEGLGRREFLECCAASFVTGKFDRARIYEATQDTLRNRKILVLTVEAPAPNDQRAGWVVDYDESTVARRRSGLHPAVGCWQDSDGYRWVDHLELSGKAWVEVPLTVGADVVGLLACDWAADDASELGVEKLTTLRACGALIGAHLSVKSLQVLDHYRQARSEWQISAPHDIVLNAAEHLAREVDAAATAVFAFSWPHQTLTKLTEHFADDDTRELADAFPLLERYLVGQHLTGTAWVNENVHHVPDFRSLKELPVDQLIAPESDRWHSDLLGCVKSVMYARVGSLERRWLIRFINRATRPELPFLAEPDTLDTLLGELRSDYDSAVATERTAVMKKLAPASTHSTPSELTTLVAGALRREQINDFSLVYRQHDSTQSSFQYYHGSRARLREVQVDWRSDALCVNAAHGDSIYTLSDYRDRSPMADALASPSPDLRSKDPHGFGAVLTVAADTGRTQGALFVPLDVTPLSGRARNADTLTLGAGTRALIATCAQLVGDAIDSRASQVRSDGARRALGLIGHELRGPLARSNSSAETAVNVARRILLDQDPNARGTRDWRRIMNYMRDMWESQERVNTALELAPLVASESEGALALHFESVPLGKMIEQIVKDLTPELTMDGQRAFDVQIAEKLKSFGPLVCDRFYLAHAYKNIVRNAIKYSLPRTGAGPMRIMITAQPQALYVGVTVRNWGVEIPEERRPHIFEQWVRGEVQTDRKAITGMGLGLWLVKRIVNAHEGTVHFRSAPSGRDARRSGQRLHETDFEIRIPRDLKPGTRIYRATAP